MNVLLYSVIQSPAYSVEHNLTHYFALMFKSCFFSLYSTTFITCPAECNKTLAIKLPFLVMIIKNLKKYFTFEVQVGSNYNSSLEECRPDQHSLTKCHFSPLKKSNYPQSIFCCLAPSLLTLRCVGARRQKCPKTIQSVELSIDNQGKAFHMHHADEIGRRLESNTGISLSFLAGNVGARLPDL